MVSWAVSATGTGRVMAPRNPPGGQDEAPACASGFLCQSPDATQGPSPVGLPPGVPAGCPGRAGRQRQLYAVVLGASWVPQDWAQSPEFIATRQGRLCGSSPSGRLGVSGLRMAFRSVSESRPRSRQPRAGQAGSWFAGYLLPTPSRYKSGDSVRGCEPAGGGGPLGRGSEQGPWLCCCLSPGGVPEFSGSLVGKCLQM